MSVLAEHQSDSAAGGLRSLVADGYCFRNFEEVSTFLERHPRLVNLLREAGPRVRNFFGVGATVNLEVVTDPEGHDLPELFASIQTSASSGDALDVLERFDEEWWLNAAQPDDRLHFDVEYV